MNMSQEFQRLIDERDEALAAKEAAEAEASEALNQLDSARHSEECLKKRCRELWHEAAALREALHDAIDHLWANEPYPKPCYQRCRETYLSATIDQPKEGDRNDG